MAFYLRDPDGFIQSDACSTEDEAQREYLRRNKSLKRDTIDEMGAETLNRLWRPAVRSGWSIVWNDKPLKKGDPCRL